MNRDRASNAWLPVKLREKLEEIKNDIHGRRRQSTY